MDKKKVTIKKTITKFEPEKKKQNHFSYSHKRSTCLIIRYIIMRIKIFTCISHSFIKKKRLKQCISHTIYWHFSYCILCLSLFQETNIWEAI